MTRSAIALVLAVLFSAPAAGQEAAAGPGQSPAPPAAAANASQNADAIPTYGSLVTDLWGDFKHLPSIENAVVLGVSGGMSYIISTEDPDLTLHAVTTPGLNSAMGGGKIVGNGLFQVGVALTTFAVGHASHNVRAAQLGADLVRAQVVNAILVEGIKVAVNRDRPDGGPYSFPSGHASAAFATAAVLQRHLGWKAGAPAYAAGVYVAASRLSGNRHYMSDVLFGAAVGIVSGRTVSVGHGRKRVEVSPVMVPGGAAVQLSALPSVTPH